MSRQYILALGFGVVVVAVVIGLVIGNNFANRLTDPDEPVQVVLADGGGENQGPQGAFDLYIYRCYATGTTPPRPAGGQWDVANHQYVSSNGIPSPWVRDEDRQPCAGTDLLWQSAARVDPAVTPLLANLVWSSPIEVSSSNIQPRGAGAGLELVGNNLELNAGTGIKVSGANKVELDAPHTLKFTLEDNNTLSAVADAEMGLIKSNNTILQSDESLYTVTAIEIAFNAATFDRDVANPNTDLDAIDTGDYFGPFLAGGDGPVWMAMTQRGQSHISYVRASRVTKQSDHYALSNLMWANALTDIGSAGQSWNIIVGSAFRLTSDIPDLTTYMDDYVTREALEGHESDLFADYQPASSFLDAGTTYRTAGWTMATNTTGAPTASDSQNSGEIDTGAATIAFAQLRTDSNPDSAYTLGPALSAADYPRGTVRHISPWDPYDPDSHLRVTWTSNSTLVGTGDAAYLWATVDVVEVGNIENDSDYFRISENVPSGLDVDLPYTAIANPPWVRADVDEQDGAPDFLYVQVGGAAKRQDFADARRHIAGHISLGSYEVASNVPSTAGQVYLAAENGGRRQVNVTWATSDLETDLATYLVSGQVLRIGELEGTILGSNATKNTVPNGGYQFQIGNISGVLPSVGSTVDLVAEGQDVHPHGVGLPSACVVGQIFLLTQVSGSNALGLYACLAANVWTHIGP